MKNNIFLMTLFLLSFFPKEINAQIKRSDWYCNPVIQTDNFIYSGVGVILESEAVALFDGAYEFFIKNQWFIPQFRYRANVIQEMEFDAGKATVYPKAWGFGRIDWAFRNYSVGYKFGYLSRLFPVGFEIEADYVQDGYQVKFPWSDKKSNMIKRMISASAIVKIRFLNYEDNLINPILEVGGSYNYALHYKDGLVNDKDAVNNGFTGIIGLGFTNTNSHVTWSLRYEHAFYDFHNENFVYDGKKIFSGARSKFGRLGASISYSF